MIRVSKIAKPYILNTFVTLRPLFDTIIKECKLQVVAEIGHQFQPIGATHVFVLKESHMSIHTYPELQSAYIDIFCCNLEFDSEKAYAIIKTFFETDNLNTITLFR